MRKKHPLILFIIVCVIALSLPVFAADAGAEIVLSAPSGFYADSLELSVSCTEPDAIIFYTTDCTRPTMDSTRWEGSLSLTDASKNPNYYANRTDTSVLFDTSLLHRHHIYDTHIQVPTHSVDKCHVLRFAAYLPDGTLIAEKQGTYFIGFDNKTAYDNIYVCSLTAEPDDLYGYENGIYVNGISLDRQIEADREEPCLDDIYWAFWDTNSQWRGEQSIRRCSFELYTPDREVLLCQDCDFKIFGGASRSFLPKSLYVIANKSKGDKPFSTPFFEQAEVDKLRLCAGGQSILWSKPEAIIRELLPELILNEEQVPCAVFLEGEYAGFCYITRKVDRALFSEKFGINKKNVLYVKSYEIEEGGRAEQLYYDFLDELDFLLTMEPDAAFLEQVDQLMDLDNFAEMFAAMIYLSETDWVEFDNNHTLWRSITPEKDETGDCRWRTFYYDINSTSLSPKGDTFDFFLGDDERTILFKKLVENEDFRKLLIEKIIDLGTKKLTSERCTAVIRDYYALMGEQIDLQIARYYGGGYYSSAAGREKEVLRFFNTRYDYVWSQIVERFGADWLAENGLKQYPD